MHYLLIYCVSFVGSAPFSGGRSRLHLIDLSYVNQDFTSTGTAGAAANHTAPSHNGLGQIIPNMLNNHKKMSFSRDSKISRLLKDSIGNPTCRATVLAHVSTEEKQYKKTLQTLNMTSRIARTRRKRNKVQNIYRRAGNFFRRDQSQNCIYSDYILHVTLLHICYLALWFPIIHEESKINYNPAITNITIFVSRIAFLK